MQKLLADRLDAAVKQQHGDASAALTDHWWVQVKHEGEWVNLDPSLPPGENDLNLPDRFSVYDPQQIPDDLNHKLRIRVIVERAKDGVLQEQTVLEHTLRLADTIGTPIVLSQIPAQLESNPLTGSSDQALKDFHNWLNEQQEWTPSLLVGQNVIRQFSFTLTGDVQAPGKALLPSAGAGFFDALGGGESPPGLLTAEFIEYEFIAPGSEPRVERRALYDLIGPAVRFAANASLPPSPGLTLGLDLLRNVEILPLAAQPTVEFVDYKSAESIIAACNALLREFRRTALHEQSDSRGAAGSAPLLPDVLYALALARQSLSQVSDSVAISSPNLLTRHTGLRESAGQVAGWSALDIVRNEVTILHGSPNQRALARLSQGIADTNAEALLAQDGARVKTVADLKFDYPNGNVRWVILDGPRVEDEVAQQLDPDLLSRIQGEFTRGYLAVVPIGADSSAADIGWWRVNARDGTVLGMDAHGRGGTESETAALQVNSVSSQRAAYEMLKTVLCLCTTGILSLKILMQTQSATAAMLIAAPDALLCMASGISKQAGILGPGNALARGLASKRGTLMDIAQWVYKTVVTLMATYG
jgi:hypothetical protein